MNKKALIKTISQIIIGSYVLVIFGAGCTVSVGSKAQQEANVNTYMIMLIPGVIYFLIEMYKNNVKKEDKQ